MLLAREDTLKQIFASPPAASEWIHNREELVFNLSCPKRKKLTSLSWLDNGGDMVTDLLLETRKMLLTWVKRENFDSHWVLNSFHDVSFVSLIRLFETFELFSRHDRILNLLLPCRAERETRQKSKYIIAFKFCFHQKLCYWSKSRWIFSNFIAFKIL